MFDDFPHGDNPVPVLSKKVDMPICVTEAAPRDNFGKLLTQARNFLKGDFNKSHNAVRRILAAIQIVSSFKAKQGSMVAYCSLQHFPLNLLAAPLEAPIVPPFELRCGDTVVLDDLPKSMLHECVTDKAVVTAEMAETQNRYVCGLLVAELLGASLMWSGGKYSTTYLADKGLTRLAAMGLATHAASQAPSYDDAIESMRRLL